MNLINMNHLYYFSIIAKEKSISKASQVLHVTQPALSHQLKQLEEELDCKLFDRVGRGLELNLNGKHLLDFTNKIIRETDNVRFLLKEKRQNKFFRIIVGVDVTISNGIIYNFIKQTMLIPDLKIEIIKSHFQDLEERLNANLIDVIISINPSLNNVKSIYSLPIDIMKIVCVVPSGITHMSISEYLNSKMLISYHNTSPYRKIIDSFLLSHNIMSKSKIEVTCPWVALDLVYHGLGASFVPENMLLWQKENKRLNELTKIDMLPLQVHALISERSLDTIAYKLIVKSHQNFLKKFDGNLKEADINQLL